MCKASSGEKKNKSVRFDIYTKSSVTPALTEGKCLLSCVGEREPSVCKGCLDAANVRDVFEMEPADSAAVGILGSKPSSAQRGEWGSSTVCICSFV